MPAKRRTDQRGRSKGDGAHIRHYPFQMSSLAWFALSPAARCLEMELKALYNGFNNGRLYLSVREAALRVGVSVNTVRGAFKELEEKGFIKIAQKGSFHLKTRHATTWILTEFGCNDQLATKDFMRWRPEEIKTQPQPLIPTVSKNDTDAPSGYLSLPSTVS